MRAFANALIERVFRSLKEEVVWPSEFASHEEAEAAITAWVVDDNAERPHQAFGNRTPAEVRAQFAACAVNVRGARCDKVGDGELRCRLARTGGDASPARDSSERGRADERATAKAAGFATCLIAPASLGRP